MDCDRCTVFAAEGRLAGSSMVPIDGGKTIFLMEVPLVLNSCGDLGRRGVAPVVCGELITSYGNTPACYWSVLEPLRPMDYLL